MKKTIFLLSIFALSFSHQIQAVRYPIGSSYTRCDNYDFCREICIYECGNNCYHEGCNVDDGICNPSDYVCGTCNKPGCEGTPEYKSICTNNSQRPACTNGVEIIKMGSGADSCHIEGGAGFTGYGQEPVCQNCLTCKEGDINITKETCDAMHAEYREHTYTSIDTTITCGECINVPPSPNPTPTPSSIPCSCREGYSENPCNSNSEIQASYQRSCDNTVCYKCENCKAPICDETQGSFSDKNKCLDIQTINGEEFTFFCEEEKLQNHCGGHDNSEIITCYRRKPCSELTTSVCYEKDIDCTTDYKKTTTNVFSYNGYKCRENTTTEHYCGTCCTGIAAPWFQTVNGNLFAKDNIQGKVGYDDPNDPKNQPSHELTLDKKEDFVNAYFARQKGDFQTQVIGNSSGIPLVRTGKVENKDGKLTQRTIPNTAVIGTPGYSALRPESFRYFQELLHYESLGYCNSYHKGGSDINGIRVCKENNAQMLTSNYTIATGEKQVVFINGNLTIDLPKTDKISVDKGGFLAFIVSGDIIFKSSLGEEIINSKDYTLNHSLIAEPNKGDYDGYNQKAQIEGVFIADGKIKFEGSTVNNAFTNKPCDRKLTVAGTYVGWSGIVMSRTFSGCSNHTIKYYDEKGLEVAYKDYYTDSKGQIVVDYPDYNEFNPVITFIYRPDFAINTPAWMRSVIRLTQEVD